MNSVLRSQLQERAALAEKLLEQLRPCLQKLKDQTVGSLQNQEIEKLKKENSVLRTEIATMITRLNDVERCGGAQQVSVAKPVASSYKSAKTLQEPACDAPSNAKTEEGKKPKQEKKTKPKKENKPNNEDTAPVDVSRLLLKVGKIVDVKKHPDADSLYIETVELAEERPRTIISGLVKHVPIEQMQDKLAIFACNLKPAKMRGILSEGMIMCASTPDKVQIVDVPANAVPGDLVTFDKYPGVPDQQLNPKKKIWEAVQPDLKTDADGVATYKGSPFHIDGKGVCRAPGCPNFPIK